MTRNRKSCIPSYRLHKQSGQAIVTLTNGLGRRKDVLLGEHGNRRERDRQNRRNEDLRRRWEELENHSQDSGGFEESDPAREQPARPSEYGIQSVAKYLESHEPGEAYT
jgi:hypothetical protein